MVSCLTWRDACADSSSVTCHFALRSQVTICSQTKPQTHLETPPTKYPSQLYFFLPPPFPSLSLMTSPSYRMPLPLYGSGGLWRLISAQYAPTCTLSAPEIINRVFFSTCDHIKEARKYNCCQCMWCATRSQHCGHCSFHQPNHFNLLTRPACNDTTPLLLEVMLMFMVDSALRSAVETPP